MDDLAFSSDDIETFTEPFVYHKPVHSSPIPKPLPLKDLIAGQPMERLTRLVGAFARSGLCGSVDPRDAMWLGNELGGLREFMILKADYRWVGQILEALGRALGPHRRTWDPEALALVVRLRRMRNENWPPAPSAWAELLTLVEMIENPRVEAEPTKLEPKDSSLAGKKPVKLAASAVKIMAALRLHHRSGHAGELNLEPVGRNELARLAGVGNSSVDRFWEARGGSECYERLCLEGGWKLEGFLEKLDRPFPVQAFAFDERIHRGACDETGEIDD